MRSERRTSRNRVYTLVGAVFMLLVCFALLRSALNFTQRRLDTRWYAFPDRTLRGLAEAMERFRLNDLDDDGQRDYPTSLDELEAAGQITSRLARGHVRGYRYELHADAADFRITATPDVAAVGTGALHYSIDRMQVVRAAVGAPAGPEADIFWHPQLQYERWGGPRPAALPAPPEEEP
jgi:hypothetical protein